VCARISRSDPFSIRLVTCEVLTLADRAGVQREKSAVELDRDASALRLRRWAAAAAAAAAA